jgi:asparagine synthase (glutamine-hydrolysing)
MCGIFAILNNNYGIPSIDINQEFMKGQARGPEFSKLDEQSYIKMALGFHRLAINGLNNESNQPLVVNDVVLICNGEIYNYKELYKLMSVEPDSDSDCEVIIHLFIKYGIEQTLTMLDGVFSFILFDNRVSEDLNSKVYIARDPFGVRPLYYLKNIYDEEVYSNKHSHIYGFASELKCLEYIYNSSNHTDFVLSQFKPGTYSVFNLSNRVHSVWQPIQENVTYFVPGFSHNWINQSQNNCENMYNWITSYLISAVYKRCITTERPVACLLSGGLDSSLIAALVNNYYKTHNLTSYKLETYSIGLKGSEDLKYAKIMADYLETNHTEIIVTEDEMFDAIPEVIFAIESYDTTTVRASIGNYLLGKYIREHSEAKVIFNGDGSDELFGGYLYMNKCCDDIEFDKETRRLLKDIHLFDVLRSDKSISSNGLEPRTPFLDKNFVNYVLSIPPYFRNHKNYQNNIEKFILRNSFSKEFFTDWKGRQVLPDQILWRKKEAFSDGVSNLGRSLYQILQEKIALQQNLPAESANVIIEKQYYKEMFDYCFSNCESIVPYYWMPKYTDATDPSARTLEFYNNIT